MIALVLFAGHASAQEAVSDAKGATLRALDKISGQVVDISLANGERRSLGRIEIELGDCRYPVGNPAGDAYAFVTIREAGVAEPVFRGWMVGSAPALNAMDHPRYDVWVMRCQTS